MATLLAPSSPPRRPHAPSVARLEALPADVLVLILRCLPIVPRVRTMSRLSKYLNALGYRSIDVLSPGAVHNSVLQRLTSDVLARLPSLTDMHVHIDGEGFILPTTLRVLHIISNGPADMKSFSQAPLPHLTSLSLSLFGSQEGVTDVITKVASSLQSISLFINMSRGPQGQLAECLHTLHLPQLKELRIAFTNADNTALLAFFRRHAPQLTSLSFIHPPRPASLIFDVALPNLTSLSDAPPDMMAGLAAQCPKLAALHSHHLAVPTDLPLRSLHHMDLDTGQIARLPLYKHLTVISNAQLYDANPLANLGLAHLVKSCELIESPSTAFLSAATSLTSLSIRYDSLDADAQFAFPALTELVLMPREAHTGVFTEEVAMARRLLRGCPKLTHVVLGECGNLTGAETSLDALVRELDARGTVQSLEIWAVDGDDLQRFAASLATHWLTVRVESYVCPPGR